MDLFFKYVPGVSEGLGFNGGFHKLNQRQERAIVISNSFKQAAKKVNDDGKAVLGCSSSRVVLEKNSLRPYPKENRLSSFAPRTSFAKP